MSALTGLLKTRWLISCAELGSTCVVVPCMSLQVILPNMHEGSSLKRTDGFILTHLDFGIESIQHNQNN